MYQGHWQKWHLINQPMDLFTGQMASSPPYRLIIYFPFASHQNGGADPQVIVQCFLKLPGWGGTERQGQEGQKFAWVLQTMVERLLQLTLIK